MPSEDSYTTGLVSAMKDYIEAVTMSENLETFFLHKHDRGMGVTLMKGKIKIGILAETFFPVCKSIFSRRRRSRRPDGRLYLVCHAA